MSMPGQARLKSTDELLIILAERTFAGQSYFLCKLPPQAPGHQERLQWVRASRLKLEAGGR